eukprot:c16789_g1_i1 orf=254-1255(+)
MTSELGELVAFLSSPSAQVKKAAVDIVQGLTGTEEGICSLTSQGELLLPSLLCLLHCGRDIAQPAAEALVNLSSEPKLAEDILKLRPVEQAMKLLGKLDQAINELLILLLANLTQLESGTGQLLQERENVEGLYMRKLVRLFTNSSEGNKGVKDQYEHIASILVNVTRFEAGRKLLLEPKIGLLKQILLQTDSGNVIRRKGVAGMLRNCSFEAGTQLPSLLSISQFLWPALFLPLAGRQAYATEDTSKMPLELASPLSHEREPESDKQVRIEAAEALYLIAIHEDGRRALWAVNGPRILQIGYEDEEDPQVMEAYERLGSLLVEESGIQVGTG